VDWIRNQNKWDPFKEESSDWDGASYFHIQFKDIHEDYGIFVFHSFDETKRVSQISFQAADGHALGALGVADHSMCNLGSNYCAPRSWDFVGANHDYDTECDAHSNWQVLCSVVNQIVNSEDERIGCFVEEADRNDYNCVGIRINKDQEGSDGLVAVRNIKMNHILPNPNAID